MWVCVCGCVGVGVGVGDWFFCLHNFTTSAGHFCFEKDFAKKAARENFRKFSLFTGVFLKLFTPGFFFHALKSAFLFTPTFTPGFFVAIDHGLLFASRALFCELFTGG